MLYRALCVYCGLLVVPQTALAQDTTGNRERNSLTLAEVIVIVKARHPLVRAAEARVSAARGSRMTAGLWTNPVLTHQVENAAFPGSDAPVGLEREVMTFAMLPLEPLYQRWPRVDRAAAEVRAAEASLEAVRRRAQLDAAHAFYRVALAEVAVNAVADVQHWLDSLVSYTRLRVNEGVVAESDLIRLQVELNRTEAEVTMRRVEHTRALIELKSHLGDAASERSRVEFADTALAVELPPLGQLQDAATARRPELIEARSRVAATRAARATERSMILRELSAMVGTKSMSGERSLMAGLSAPLPLFDQNRGEIQRATGERRAAEIEQEWVERNVSAEVAAAHETATALLSQTKKLQTGFLPRAEEGLRIAVSAYREGATSLLQVLDAVRVLREARISFYELLFAQHESVIGLRAAVGSDLLHPLPYTVPAPETRP